MKKKRSKNQSPRQTQQHRGKNRYISLLNMSKVEPFRYYAKEILGDSGMEENVWTPLLATIVAKGSTTGIEEAHDYIESRVQSGDLPEYTAKKLHRLLNKYRKWR